MTTKDMISALIDLGYSQVRIADETGITQATISRIASGKHKDTSYSNAKLIERCLENARGSHDQCQVVNS